MRDFVSADLQNIPDAVALLKFRHLLEEHRICERIFEDVRDRMERAGLIMRGGTIVDAAIIEAPSSTRNRLHERDPEMSSTKKGANYHFGMKVHGAVDACSGYVAKIVGTTGKDSDISQLHKLIRSDDRVVYADSGYIGIEKRAEIQEREQFSKIEFRIISNLKQSAIDIKNMKVFNGTGLRKSKNLQFVASIFDHQKIIRIQQNSLQMYPEKHEQIFRIIYGCKLGNAQTCQQNFRLFQRVASQYSRYYSIG